MDLASFQGHQWGLTQAGRWLRQAGWKVLPSPEDNGVVVAKDRVTLILWEIEDSEYQLVLVRAQTTPAVPLSAAGTLLALLGGWPLGVWLSRGIASHRDPERPLRRGDLVAGPAAGTGDAVDRHRTGQHPCRAAQRGEPTADLGRLPVLGSTTASAPGVIAVLLVILTAIVSTRRSPRAEDIAAIPAAAIAA